MESRNKESLPEFIKSRISSRKEENLYRSLDNHQHPRRILVDFSSNDYLGFAKSHTLYQHIKENEKKYEALLMPGAGASRLLSGNHPLYDIAEKKIAEFHDAEAALIFNSGFDANTGIFSALTTRHDIILFDEYIHASIRDGIRLGLAKSYSFRHNNLEDLKKKVSLVKHKTSGRIIVAIESVYSMDGIERGIHHQYLIEDIVEYCNQNELYLIVDEAHATGVFGEKGEGLIAEKKLTKKVFARVHTFGKALGVHGAAVCGSIDLRDYLINFARSFIYTTALPPHSLLSILSAYEFLEKHPEEILKLHEIIRYFKNNTLNGLDNNDSPVHYKIIGSNLRTRAAAKRCQDVGFDIRAILSPTVPKNTERLRICLHSFNSHKEVGDMIQLLESFT